MATTSIIEKKTTSQKIKKYTNDNKHNIERLYGMRAIIVIDKNRLSHS